VKLMTDRFWRQLEVATLRDVDQAVAESKGNVRETLQVERSALSLAGIGGEGDDTAGARVHRVPPNA
jgi:hypothetical protein